MKKTVAALAPGKINLALDITGILPNGYHEVDTVLQAIDLCDTITVTKQNKDGILISCDRPRVPCDETNHAYIAAIKFFETFGIDDRSIMIDICKRVPIQAGLGGGSADAAGVLVALNELYDVHADMQALCSIGVQVGADVPFCLLGGTRRARGIGEQFEQVPNLPDSILLIAQPSEGISTPESYRRYDQLSVVQRADVETLVCKLKFGDLKGTASHMGNVLEQAARLSEIPEIKKKMNQSGALGALMSGSGSAVFGIFDSRWKAKHCMRKLYSIANCVLLAHPIDHGAKVIRVNEYI